MTSWNAGLDVSNVCYPILAIDKRGERKTDGGIEQHATRERNRKEHTSRSNLLARGRHPDNHTNPPTLMARLQRRPHDPDIPRAIKRIIAAAIRHLHQLLLNTRLAEFLRIHKIRRPKLLRPLLLPIIHIHNNDLPRPVLHRALDHAQPHTPGAEDSYVRVLLHIGRDNGCAVPRRDTAAQETGSVHGSLGRDGYDGDVGDYRVLTEGGSPHEVQQRLALAFEARGAVGHDAFALGSADSTAEVCFARAAEFAGAAFGGAAW